ncbi:MAG: heme o synthase [Candidatus Dormibacter sp.]
MAQPRVSAEAVDLVVGVPDGTPVIAQQLTTLAAAGLTVARPRPSLTRTLTDYLSLTKPRIMLLLLITEISALVVAAHGRLQLGLVLTAMAGGALSAGGAAAVNCWYDRDIDLVMSRTCQRPLPAGRIPPSHALAFGCLLGLAGFVVLALGANLVAASLALGGGVFYAVVYTMWLKRSFIQNIVIGGAAGAIPPLVGWAAVTHGLSPLALVLFAIIFCWTPPHFWALALLIRREYVRAGVPMLPAVRGDVATRRAIVLYSVLLFGISLVPTIWLGTAYLVSGGILGLVFVGLSLVTFRDGGRRSAAILFHYSVAYLGLLFVTMALTATLA